MKITITSDDGEVYATVRIVGTEPTTGFGTGPLVVVDEDGDEATLDSVIDDAFVWEKNR